MENQTVDSASSKEDSDDLDDVPLSVNPNGRYENDYPLPTSRGPPVGFGRPGFGFHLNLVAAIPDDDESPRVPNGLPAMRSEPVYLPETTRPRQPPGLALNLNRATTFTGIPEDVTAEPLNSRRGPLKPPALSLINPASASPVPSGAPTPIVHAAGDTPSCLRQVAWPPPTTTRRGAPVRVELVTSAFVLQPPSRAPNDDEGGPLGAPAASTSDRIADHVTRQLGIAASDLQFFELRPLDEGAIPESCTHLGVMVRNCGFSLSALEDMLARAKRDEQLTSLLEGAMQDSRQHAAEAKQHAEKLSKQNEELAVLRERLQAAEATNQHLREQLLRSDEHRQLLGSTIRTIKKEFEDFKNRVVVEGAVDQLPPLQNLSLVQGGAGSGPGSAGGSGGGAGPGTATGSGFGAGSGPGSRPGSRPGSSSGAGPGAAFGYGAAAGGGLPPGFSGSGTGPGRDGGPRR